MTTARLAGSILIVEDDEALRRILTIQLRAAGLTVTEASSAEDAAETLDAGLRPDLVLLDVNLPGETGWEFLRRPSMTEAGDPPVVITSATAISPKRLAEFHIAGYLPKPCPTDTLLDTVARLVQRGAATPDR